MIPVRSLRISTRIFQRGANMFEKSMKRRASLDFPSGENNLVSPRTSPTESLPSSPSGLTFIRERIFLAGKREPAAVWPPLAAATFYRLITPSSPSPLVVLFARPLFATPSLRRFPRRGRETRRGGTTCKNPHVARRRKHVRGMVEPTPFTSSCRWIRGSPEMEDSTIREKTLRCRRFRVCAWWMRFPQRFIQKRKRSKRKFEGFRDPSSWRKGL